MCLASIVMTEIESAELVDFATGAAETTRSRPPAERLLAGDPEQVARNYFSDSGGRFFAGVWESEPCGTPCGWICGKVGIARP